jgi:hypothetical protein
MQRLILAGQGAFYVATGLWAIVSIGSFQRVTGPKVDTWLVKTVGALVSVVGMVLLLGAWRRRTEVEVLVLATGSAVALAAIDTVYSLNGRISKVYLLDAVAETVLAGALATARALDARDLAPLPSGLGDAIP